MTISPNRIVWYALTGSITIILALVSAWAHDMTQRTTQIEARQNLTDQHFIELQGDIRDLREHIDELRESVKSQQRGEVRNGR